MALVKHTSVSNLNSLPTDTVSSSSPLLEDARPAGRQNLRALYASMQVSQARSRATICSAALSSLSTSGKRPPATQHFLPRGVTRRWAPQRPYTAWLTPPTAVPPQHTTRSCLVAVLLANSASISASETDE